MVTKTEALDFLERFINTLPDAIVVFDTHGSIMLLNDIMLRSLGLQALREEYLNQPVTTLFSKGDIYENLINCFGDTRQNFSIPNYRLKRKIFEVNGKRIAEGMILIMHDITTNVKVQNNNTKYLIRGQEKERKRLAEEIHDGVGPFLSTVKLSIDLETSKTTDLSTKSNLKNISTQISEISTEIRQISHDLMPASLLDFGLIAGIENQIAKLNLREELTITLHNDLAQANNTFTQEQELNIFRIVQESMHNSIKHAGGTKIDIYLSCDEKNLRVKISDNGSGLKDKSKPEGIGLRNIKTRTKSLGGRTRITSRENQGLTIKLLIPLNPNL